MKMKYNTNSLIEGKCRDDRESEAMFGLRFVIHKSFNLSPVERIKLLSLQYLRTKLKIVFTNALFSANVIVLDWMIPTAPFSIIGEIPIKLFTLVIG